MFHVASGNLPPCCGWFCNAAFFQGQSCVTIFCGQKCEDIYGYHLVPTGLATLALSWRKMAGVGKYQMPNSFCKIRSDKQFVEESRLKGISAISIANFIFAPFSCTFVWYKVGERSGGWKGEEGETINNEVKTREGNIMSTSLLPDPQP